MKIFQCGHCDYPLFFENNQCENCGHSCGYRDGDRKMLTFDPLSSSLISDREKIEYKYCKNKEHEVCNWLLERATNMIIVLLVNSIEQYPIFPTKRTFRNGKIWK